MESQNKTKTNNNLNLKKGRCTMGWQEEEAIRRCGVPNFWDKLIKANEKILPEIRAIFSTSDYPRKVQRLQGRDYCIEYTGTQIDDGNGKGVAIKYWPSAGQLRIHGNLLTEKDVNTILKNICTGKPFYYGLVALQC